MIYNSRICKTPEELDVMKHSIRAAAEGHIELMHKCKPGMRESQLMAYYRHHGLFTYNVKDKAYPDIIASGKNAAVLHYDKNDKIIADGELVLCDCAHKMCGYCSDITTTFPSNGKFTPKQKLVFLYHRIRDIYEIVLGINRTIQATLKPGTKWNDMERLCSKLLLEGLLKLGLVKGKLEELVKGRVSNLFMPHGLGHFIVLSYLFLY